MKAHFLANLFIFLSVLFSCSDVGIRDNITDPASQEFKRSSSEITSSSSQDSGLSSSVVVSSSSGISSSSFACENTIKGDSLTDCRDGKSYTIVDIGNQTWTAKNIAYDTLKARCLDDIEANCENHGRFYSYEAALVVCPYGWKLPSIADWNELIDFVDQDADGNPNNNNEALSLRNNSDWDLAAGFESQDTYKFRALPSGFYNMSTFADKDFFGYWWVSNKLDKYSTHIEIDFNDSSIYFNDNYDKYWYSVRCILDK